MNNQTKRLLLFLFGCIVARSLLVLIAYKYRDNQKIMRIMAILALVLVAGWSYIIITNSRDTDPEVFGDKIWWKDIRPIHASLYFLFALLALSGKPYAWVVLAVDVVFGLAMFIHHRYNS